MPSILTLALLALTTLLAVAPVSVADEPPSVPAGMELYIVILAPGSATEPDIASLGGQVLRASNDRRLIAVPPGTARVLEQHERVAALQPVWTGERAPAPRGPIAKAHAAEVPATVTQQTPFWSRSYDYDGSGNVKSSGNDRFGYDTAGRIVGGLVNQQTEKYGYDPFGNLTTISTPAATRTLNVNKANNHLRTGSDIDLHDSVGNLLALPDSGTSYEYDALGMLIQLGPTGTNQTRRMIYTADDERIAVQTVGGDTRYVVRGFDGKVLREWNHSPVAIEWVRDYVYADGQLIAGDRQVPKGQPGLRHFHTDHLGSVRVISRGDKALISRHDYFPFGTEATSTTQEDTRFGYRPPDPMKFTSHERDYLGAFNVDNDEYLDYMHARYYSAGWGRFLSVDPGGFDPKKPQSWNRYAYVMNNPVNAIDPNGKETYIVAHGEGELSPAMQGQAYDVGRQFEIAANTRADQIRGSKGYNEARDDVVVVNTPNADALVAATNKQYSSGKIARVEVFSHAWSGGLNLGGAGNRHVTASTASQINTSNFTRNASFTLWGCNAGTTPSGGGRSFAQQLSNALQMPVRAHTGPTEFNNQGRGNPPMVPSNPQRGAMRVFNPENPNLLRLP